MRWWDHFSFQNSGNVCHLEVIIHREECVLLYITLTLLIFICHQWQQITDKTSHAHKIESNACPCSSYKFWKTLPMKLCFHQATLAWQSSVQTNRTISSAIQMTQQRVIKSLINFLIYRRYQAARLAGGRCVMKNRIGPTGVVCNLLQILLCCCPSCSVSYRTVSTLHTTQTEISTNWSQN